MSITSGHKSKYVNTYITSHKTQFRKDPRIQEKISYETFKNSTEPVDPNS